MNSQTTQNRPQQTQNPSVTPEINPTNPITPIPTTQVAGSEGFVLVAFVLSLTLFYTVLKK
ncbi:hypothetical protein PCC7424_2503 [Gloeothece citriformis PCC 7424]|uniref:Uncharacterized protein n=1 Tax=Gloeothece citriformis (strain PCC 7424) TaxID=65393 RepID=B7KK35_GLOC7|nr:hypothetical protein [Gloeothece citriformis]ACK70920.1 hypothetical protein PCC7424_2503 [Gloeothece citriformis PCC 7424]